VHGGLDQLGRLLEGMAVDEVLVTIPDASPERLELVLGACDETGVSCRFVRREIAPPPLLEAPER